MASDDRKGSHMPRNEGTVMTEVYPPKVDKVAKTVQAIFGLYDVIFVHGFVRYGLFVLVSLPVRLFAKANLIYCLPKYEEN